MGRLYTFAFQSVLGIGGTNNKKYSIEWSDYLPEKKYKVYMTCQGASAGSTTSTAIMSVFCNLGQDTTTNGGLLGTFYNNSGAGFPIFAYNGRNDPIYLNQRPANNEVVVNFFRMDTGEVFVPSTYTLILTFEEI